MMVKRINTPIIVHVLFYYFSIVYIYRSLNSMYSSYTSKVNINEKSGEYERFNL